VCVWVWKENTLAMTPTHVSLTCIPLKLCSTVTEYNKYNCGCICLHIFKTKTPVKQDYMRTCSVKTLSVYVYFEFILALDVFRHVLMFLECYFVINCLSNVILSLETDPIKSKMRDRCQTYITEYRLYNLWRNSHVLADSHVGWLER